MSSATHGRGRVALAGASIILVIVTGCSTGTEGADGAAADAATGARTATTAPPQDTGPDTSAPEPPAAATSTAAAAAAEDSDGPTTRPDASSASGDGDAAVTATPSPAATTPVAAPEGRGIAETVAVNVQEQLEPVPMTEPVGLEGRVTVEVAQVSRGEVEARAPGEIGGPAVQVRLRMTNDSGRPSDLTGVTVSAEDARRTQLSPLLGDPANPFSGTLTPGADSEGTYVFSLPEGTTQPLTISVNYAADAPVARFVATPLSQE